MRQVIVSALIAAGALALAPPALSQEQDAARELIERGRISEDHRRDFKEAQRLYQRALEAAEKAGDKAAAKAARARLAALERRKSGQADADEEAAIEGRLKGLTTTIIQTSDEAVRTKAAANLLLYGDRALPFLRSLLTDWSRSAAADALITMKSAAADKVLAEILSSPDPLQRKLVAKALRADSSEALLLKALEDKVAGVRTPIYRLALKPTPRVIAAMKAGALAGSKEALGWIAGKATGQLPALCLDGRAPEELRRSALGYLANYISTGYDDWSRIVEVLEGSAESERFSYLLYQTSKQIPAQAEGRLPEALRARYERLALAKLASKTKNVSDYAERLLVKIGGRELAVETIAGRVTLSDNDCLRAILAALKPVDRGPLAEALISLPKDRLKSRAGLSGLSRMADFDIRAEPERALAFFDALPAGSGADYIEMYFDRREVSAADHGCFRPRLQALLRSLVAQPELSERAYRRVLDLVREFAPVELLPDLLYLKRLSRGPALQSSLRAPWHPRSSLVWRVSYQSMLLAVLAAHPREAGAVLRSHFKVRGAFDRSKDAPEFDWPHRPLVAFEVLSSLPEAVRLRVYNAIWPSLHHPQLRRSLVLGLCRFEDEEATLKLLKIYPDLSDPDLRAAVLKRFGSELTREALPHIEAAIGDRKAEVRAAALKALKAFEQHRLAVEELRALRLKKKTQADILGELLEQLKNPKRAVVLGAIQALGALRDKAALPPLVALLERADKEMEKTIRAAIARIGGSSRPI